MASLPDGVLHVQDKLDALSEGRTEPQAALPIPAEDHSRCEAETSLRCMDR